MLLILPVPSSAQVSQQPNPAPSSTSAPPQGDQGDLGVVGDKSEEADEPAAPQPKTYSSVASASAAAWEMLNTAATAPKPRSRIDALAALGTMTGVPKAEAMVIQGFGDKDRDVRLSATIAAATLKSRTVVPALHKALDDPAPEVSYAAAVALWKMHDHAGDEILYGVLSGERKAHSGFVGTEMHEMNKDLHSPSTLATIGAEQGAYALLGPFGIGLDAAMLIRKTENGNTTRVLTINLIGADRRPQTRAQLIKSLNDKDYFVRGAAAHALGGFRGKDVSDALLQAFADKKPAVRYAAAASYLRVTGVHAGTHAAAPASAKHQGT